MQKLYTCITLVLVWFSFNSFTPEGYRDLYQEAGTFDASINGQNFVTRQSGFYRAMLVNKPNPFAATAADRNRVAASLYFYGVDTVDEQGNPLNEYISIEYPFTTFAQGEISDINFVSFDMHYDKSDFYMLPEGNFFKVSKLEWSADKTSFTLSGKFDCMMHKRGYGNEQQPAVRLKGYITDVKVSVPPWIAARITTAPRAEAGQ